MPSSLYVPILVAGMLITGSSNSLWSKWQERDPLHQDEESAASDDPQSAKDFPDAGPQTMHGWKYLLLWFPAACDLTGTTLMNVGLLYTPVSIYQMTRGALILFVAALSVIFLRRRLWLYQWVSLVTVMGGVSLVGYSGSLIKESVKEPLLSLLSPSDGRLGLDGAVSPRAASDQPEGVRVLIGIFFVLFAQVFTATQMVVEEKIMSKYTVAPVVAVGFEGLFGFVTILIMLPFLAISPLADPTSPSYSPFFDLPRGWTQMVTTPTVLWSGIAIAISICFFNYFGLSVTRTLSATARSIIDTCRTLSIWVVSLGLGWEKILFPITLLQVSGFGLLVYGTFLFNGLVDPPRWMRPTPEVTPASPSAVLAEEESRHLLAEHALDETAALPADLGQSGFDVVPPPERGQRRASVTHPRSD